MAKITLKVFCSNPKCSVVDSCTICNLRGPEIQLSHLTNIGWVFMECPSRRFLEVLCPKCASEYAAKKKQFDKTVSLLLGGKS